MPRRVPPDGLANVIYWRRGRRNLPNGQHEKGQWIKNHINGVTTLYLSSYPEILNKVFMAGSLHIHSLTGSINELLQYLDQVLL